MNYNQMKFNSVIRMILIWIIFLLSSFTVPGGKPVMTEEMRFQSERASFYFQIKDQPFSEDLLKKCIYYERIKYQDMVIYNPSLKQDIIPLIFLNGHNCLV
jgi:hypothetical protein